MLNRCLGCYKQWEEDTRHHYCPECSKKLTAMTFEDRGPMIAIKEGGAYGNIYKSHHQDIRTRVIADDGETVLKGKKGLDYMKAHEKENPGYRQRLKEYYKDK